MPHPRHFSALVFALSLLLPSCVNLKQPAQKVEHYTLEYDFHRVQGLQPLPAVIRVEPFTTAPDYNSLGMVYREEAFRRESYVYHKWRSNPGDLVSHFVVRDMRESGVFRAVLYQEATAACTHVLEGSVDEFFELSQGSDSQAVLTVSITLLVENEPDITRRILMQRTYTISRECQPNAPPSLAKALSLGLGGISEQIVQDIHMHLAASD